MPLLSRITFHPMLPALLLLTHQVQATDLDSVLSSPLLKGCLYSVRVTRLDGTVLYERNSEKRLMPASNEKLFTAAFALHELGVDYHPTTRFWKLPDRVVVDTTGDPMLTYADLDHVKAELRLSGTEKVFVHEPFRIGYLPQWNFGDLPYNYAAPVTGFTVDRGGFEVWADSKHAYMKPAPYGTRIVLVSGGNRHVRYDPFTKTVRVYGGLPSESQMLETLSVPEPDKAAASILGSSFQQTETVPHRAADLVLEGPTLPIIIKDCLVNSDNNLAENLLLLSALHDGDLGEDPYLTATAREKDFMTHLVGVDPDDFSPDDGCGLSRENWVTTRAITKVLQWEGTQPTFDIWKESLASPGNGTLKKRLQNSSFIGKTGSMNGVTALSGYLKTKDGQTLVISTLFNNHLCPNSEIRALQDSFIGKIEGSTLSGTVLEGSVQREGLLTDPSPSAVSLHRLRGLGRNRSFALQGPDRRGQSDHEVLHRSRRMGLRSG